MAIFVYKDEIISLKELLKRWENCSFGGSTITAEEIDQFIRTKSLKAYNIRKFIPENDKMSVKLTVNPDYYGIRPFYDSVGIVFLLL